MIFHEFTRPLDDSLNNTCTLSIYLYMMKVHSTAVGTYNIKLYNFHVIIGRSHQWNASSNQVSSTWELRTEAKVKQSCRPRAEGR